MLKKVKASAEDIEMEGGGEAKAVGQKPVKKPLNDFAQMGDLLSKIEAKTEKQVSHQQRMISGKKQ